MSQIRNASASVSSAIVAAVPALTRLLDFRTRAALSQRDLSKRSGVAQSTIVRLEQGEPKVRPVTIRKLARALGVKPAELMG